MKKIFIIEDEPDMLKLLKFLLTEDGYDVRGFSKGEDLLNVINNPEESKPNLVILDLMLPGMSGYEVCRYLNSDESTSNIPLLILSSRSDEFDMLTGFSLGCDDYITKPFSEKILLAKIKAVLNRVKKMQKEDKVILKINNMVIDKERFEVTVGGKIKNLTASEFKILLYLVENQGKVYTRDQIFAQIKEGYNESTERSVDISIARIRKKLGDYGKYVQSIYGVGYTFRLN